MSAGHGNAPGADASRSVRLSRSPAAATRARSFVVETLQAWQVERGAVDDAELVVSELVTNAFLHGHAETVTVALTDAEDVVRLEVSHHEADATEVTVAPLTVGTDDTHGRGLAIVDVLCSAWGAAAVDSERRVWAELVAGRAELVPAAERDAAIGELALALRVPTTAGVVGTEVARWARVRLGASFAGVALRDDDRPDHLRFVATSPPLAAPGELSFPAAADRPAAAAHRHARPYFHESRSAVVARFPDMRPLLAAAGLAALADLPLSDGGRPFGTLALAWSHGRVLDAGDRSWLAAVAEVVAVALIRVGAPHGADALTEGL